MNSICPMNFFRTTDTTDTTIWKAGFSGYLLVHTLYIDGKVAVISHCFSGYLVVCTIMVISDQLFGFINRSYI